MNLYPASLGEGRVYHDALLVVGQWIKGIIPLTSLSLCSPFCNRADGCPCRLLWGWKQAVCVNYKALGRRQMMVGQTHGLSENCLNTCPGACPSSSELPAWLTRALLRVAHHGPRHCGDVHVGHLGAQGDLPEVSGATAVAAPVPSVLLPGRAPPRPLQLWHLLPEYKARGWGRAVAEPSPPTPHRHCPSCTFS